MEQLEDPKPHEYPDPDYAAYVTRYPWVGEDDGYMPSGLRSQPQSSWRHDSPDNDGLDQSEARSMDHPGFADDDGFFEGGMTFDSDYQASDAYVT